MEPRKSPHFPRVGRVYKIWNLFDDKVYVGSTFQTLSQRFGDHKAEINSKRRAHRMVYAHMRELGTENFRIELIEEITVQSRDELFKQEGRWIRKLKAELNQFVAGRSRKEYRNESKELISDRNRQYRINNQETVCHNDHERHTQKVMCICGTVMSSGHVNRPKHLNSAKHQQYLQFGGLENLNLS